MNRRQIVRLDIIAAAAIIAVGIVVAASSITVHKALAITDPNQRSAKDLAPGQLAINSEGQISAKSVAPGQQLQLSPPLSKGAFIFAPGIEKASPSLR